MTAWGNLGYGSARRFGEVPFERMESVVVGTLLQWLLILVALSVSCWGQCADEVKNEPDIWWEIENGTISPLCENREVHRSTSPSGAVDLVVFRQACFRQESGYFSLVPTGEPINRRYGNLGRFYPKYNDPDDISVIWGLEDTLLLTVRSLDMTWLYDLQTRSTVLSTVREVAGEPVLVQLEEDPFLPERDCLTRDVSRTPSPDGQFELLVFERTCGDVTTGGLSVVTPGDVRSHPNVTGFDVRANPWHEVRPRWMSDRNVVVALPSPPITEITTHGVKVTLVRPGTL